ncbi:MAG TPA: ABC transporter substrate-binding protein [Lachnospiraceae bacterium]|nr:ABC transporter substrate-binding protein [Lachnospiraceae bacterium]
MKKISKRILCMVMIAATLLMCSCGDKENDEEVRIGSLKGPTTIGLIALMEKSDAQETGNAYSFTMETQSDVLLTMMMQGELDIALVPANVAAVLYNKTQGGICVIDINTLGVLYLVSKDTAITGITDLSGRTIYLTGKGTTPDYVLRYLLEENGISTEDVTLEYKSEATEVAAILAENPDAIGLLPQPFATAVTQQNSELSIVADLSAEWDATQKTDGSMMVTGVTIVRREFLEANEELVKQFLQDHMASAEMVETDVTSTAAGAVQYGIMEKEAIAQLAIPYCNVVYMDGTAMQNALSGYLNVLFAEDPTSVGGSLPAEDFYYLSE